jgi:hypothetical protein
MSHRTTSKHYHATKEQQPHCEASHTFRGEYCENLGTQRTMDGLLLLCEQHARQFGLEEQIACWEAILLHIELWSKIARRWGKEDIVHLLQLERAKAATAHKRAYKDLEQLAKKEGHQLKSREIYGFMS